MSEPTVKRSHPWAPGAKLKRGMSFKSAVPALVSAKAQDRRTPSRTQTLAERRVPPERSHKRTPNEAMTTGAASALA